MEALTESSILLKYDIVAIGDSQTGLADCAGLGVPAYRNYVAVLAELLRNDGCLVRPRVFGRGGDTTSNFFERANNLRLYSTPKIGIIDGGVNDAAQGTRTGTLVSATINTVTLPGTQSAVIGSFIGCTITITGGTGSGQSNVIIAYNDLRVATMKNNWVTTPDATSTFSIAATNQAVIQSNIQGLVKILKYGVSGDGTNGFVHVWSQDSLPARGLEGQRYLVLSDTSATGGAMPTNGNQHPNIAGDFSASARQSVWEYRNPLAGQSGWGRVAITGTPAFAEGTNMIIVMSSNYLNFSTAGDNYNTITGTGTQFTQYANLRVSQKAAATAENVVYCDLYDYQSKLIYSNGNATFQGVKVNPETTQGSFKWHYEDANQHHETYGHQIKARAVYYTIQNAGWIPALK